MSKKTAVVYYSLNGNTQFIAASIGQELEADLYKIKPKKEIPKKGFLKFFLGGKQVVFKQEPEIDDGGFDPQAYDTIFLGTPVWADSLSAPMRSFLHKYHFTDKELAFFCSCGDNGRKAFEMMRGLCPSCRVLGNKDFIQPLENDKRAASKEARSWALGLLGGVK